MPPYTPTRQDLDGIRAAAVAELRRLGVVSRRRAKELKRAHVDTALDLLFKHADMLMVRSNDGFKIAVHPADRAFQ